MKNRTHIDNSDSKDDDSLLSPIDIIEIITDPSCISSNLRKIEALHKLGIETKLWTLQDDPKDVDADINRLYRIYIKEEFIKDLSKKITESSPIKHGPPFTRDELQQIIDTTIEYLIQIKMNYH